MPDQLLRKAHWGPAGWTLIHAVAWAAPERPSAEERRQLRAFYVALAPVLPCRSCAEHMQQLVARDLPDEAAPALASREALAKQTVAWHNEVNARLGRRQRSWQEVQREWGYGSQAHHLVVLLVVGATAASLLYYYSHHRRRRRLVAPPPRSRR